MAAPSGAYENVLLAHSMTVSGDNLSASTDIHVFVKCGDAENDVVPAASGDLPIGISLGTGSDGKDINVALVGISKIRLAGTVKRGNPLKPTSGTNDGRAVFTTHIAAHGAIAMQDGASGEVIACLLTQGFGS